MNSIEPFTTSELALVRDLFSLQKEDLEKISVCDRDGDLILIHYNNFDDEAMSESLHHLRGTVIDTKKKYVVCSGGYHIPTATLDKIIPESEENTLIFKDSDGNARTLNSSLDSLNIVPFISRVNFRCFLHRGKFYSCTYKRLDPRSAKSRWSDHGTAFSVMYDKAGGPTREQLYPEGVIESPFIYHLTVFDPEINIHGLLDVDTFIVLNNVEKMWRGEDVYSQQEKGFEHTKDILQTREVDLEGLRHLDERESKNVITLKPLSIAEAQTFLQSGHYPELESKGCRRLESGESILVCHKDRSSGRLLPLHVKSVPYAFRESLGEDDHNRYMCVVKSFSASLLDLSLLKLKMPLVKLPESEEWIDREMESGKLLLTSFQVADEAEVASYNAEDLRTMIWYVHLLTSTRHYRNIVRNSLRRFNKDYEDLLGWFVRSLIPDGRNAILNLKSRRGGARAVSILQSTYHQAIEGTGRRGGISRSQMEKQAVLISAVLSKEDPEILYALFRLMRSETKTSSLNITEPDARPLNGPRNIGNQLNRKGCENEEAKVNSRPAARNPYSRKKSSYAQSRPAPARDH